MVDTYQAGSSPKGMGAEPRSNHTGASSQPAYPTHDLDTQGAHDGMPKTNSADAGGLICSSRTASCCSAFFSAAQLGT